MINSGGAQSSCPALGNRKRKMARKIFYKTIRISRGLALATGAVVISAVVLGAATAALAAAPGDPFRLGKVNAINKVTKLVGKAKSPRLVIDNNGSGVALRLLVESGKPPMQVNSSKKVARLNADRLDGKDSTDFVSGYNLVNVSSAFNSSSIKSESAYCPSGQKVLGGGAFVSTSETGFAEGTLSNIALVSNSPYPVGPPARAWYASAGDMDSIDQDWRLIVYAICAETAA